MPSSSYVLAYNLISLDTNPRRVALYAVKEHNKNPGVNDAYLHAKDFTIEFHRFISVSNLEDEM